MNNRAFQTLAVASLLTANLTWAAATPMAVAVAPVRSTGQSMGHIADATVVNQTGETRTCTLGPALIPGTRVAHGYVIATPVTVTVEPGKNVVVPLQGYALETRGFPVPQDDLLPAFEKWVFPSAQDKPGTVGVFLEKRPHFRFMGKEEAFRRPLEITFPGSDEPFPFKIEISQYPTESAPLIFSALDAIRAAYETLVVDKQFKTPYAHNSDDERQHIIQYTLLLYANAVQGIPFSKQKLQQLLAEDMPVSRFSPDVKKELEKKTDSLWLVIIQVASKAAIVAPDEPAAGAVVTPVATPKIAAAAGQPKAAALATQVEIPETAPAPLPLKQPITREAPALKEQVSIKATPPPAPSAPAVVAAAAPIVVQTPVVVTPAPAVVAPAVATAPVRITPTPEAVTPPAPAAVIAPTPTIALEPAVTPEPARTVAAATSRSVVVKQQEVRSAEVRPTEVKSRTVETPILVEQRAAEIEKPKVRVPGRLSPVYETAGTAGIVLAQARPAPGEVMPTGETPFGGTTRSFRRGVCDKIKLQNGGRLIFKHDPYSIEFREADLQLFLNGTKYIEKYGFNAEDTFCGLAENQVWSNVSGPSASGADTRVLAIAAPTDSLGSQPRWFLLAAAGRWEGRLHFRQDYLVLVAIDPDSYASRKSFTDRNNQTAESEAEPPKKPEQIVRDMALDRNLIPSGQSNQQQWSPWWDTMFRTLLQLMEWQNRSRQYPLSDADARGLQNAFSQWHLRVTAALSGNSADPAIGKAWENFRDALRMNPKDSELQAMVLRLVEVQYLSQSGETR